MNPSSSLLINQDMSGRRKKEQKLVSVCCVLYLQIREKPSLLGSRFRTDELTAVATRAGCPRLMFTSGINRAAALPSHRTFCPDLALTMSPAGSAHMTSDLSLQLSEHGARRLAG